MKQPDEDSSAASDPTTDEKAGQDGEQRERCPVCSARRPDHALGCSVGRKAGALIAAEIDRLQRAAASSGGTPDE